MARIFSEHDAWDEFWLVGLEMGADGMGGVMPEPYSCAVINESFNVVGQTMIDAIDDMTKTNEGQHLLSWIVLVMWAVMDSGLQDRFIAGVAKSDYRHARVIYQLHPSLSDEHDKILFDCFSDKLPNVVRLLQSGEIVRAKNG